VFAVGTRISAHARELGPDLIDQELLLLRFSDGESALQNIIYKNDCQKPGYAKCPQANSLAN
jgi:hypothetical protein